MPLTSTQKYYIKKNFKKMSLEEMASSLSISPDEIKKYAKNHWKHKEKYKKLFVDSHGQARGTYFNSSFACPESWRSCHFT